MKLSIRNKLILVAALLACAGLAAWLISFQFIRLTKQNLDEIKNAKLRTLLMTQEAQNKFESYMNNALVAVSTKEVQILEDDEIKIEEIENIFIQIRKTDPNYKELFLLAPQVIEIHKFSLRYIKSLSSTSSKEGNMDVLLRDNMKKIEFIKATLEKMRRRARIDFDRTIEKMNRVSDRFAMGGVVVLAFLIALVILFAMVLLATIARRMNRLKDHFVTTGIDSLEPISETGQDELGDLLKAFNKMLMSIKEARSELVDKAFVENIINTIRDVIIVCGNEWRIIRMNEKAKEFFEARKEDPYGKSIFEVLHTCESRKGLSLEEMQKSLMETGTLNTDALMYGEDQKELTVHVSGGAMNEISKNTDMSFVLIIRDITNEVASERENLILQAQLSQSAKLASLGTLGAGVAHELTNPLTAVMGYAELIRKSKDLPEKVQGFGNRILRASKRMIIIIDELRNFSRDSTKQDFELLAVDVPIKGVLIFLQHRFDLIEIEVTLEFSKERCVILGDNNQLESVFLNFLSNSCDSFQEVKDNRKKVIHIKTVYENEMVSIIFEDNAMGIPPNKIKNIFDPFFTTKAVGAGTGLGLFVVHQIIKSHKGTIEVHSIENEGTRFKISFASAAKKDEGSLDNLIPIDSSNEKKQKTVVS